MSLKTYDIKNSPSLANNDITFNLSPVSMIQFLIRVLHVRYYFLFETGIQSSIIMLMEPIRVGCLWYERIHCCDFEKWIVGIIIVIIIFLTAYTGIMGEHIVLLTYVCIFLWGPSYARNNYVLFIIITLVVNFQYLEYYSRFVFIS